MPAEPRSGWTPVPDEFRDRVDADGLWRDLRAPSAPGRSRPALFLDRDGTVIDEVTGIARAADVRPIAAAVRAIVRANGLGIPVVIVTNQGDIGRGRVSWSEFAEVEAAVAAVVAAGGGRLDAVYAASHAPVSGDPRATPWRKPAPGMLLRAAADLGLDLARSWIAGDCASDVECGRNAGLARGWLVPTGYGTRDARAAGALAGPGFEVVVGESLDALAARLDGLAGGN